MQLSLTRLWLTPRSTMGVLLLDGEHAGYTLEPPTLVAPAKPRAVPAGSYNIVPHPSPRFHRTMPLLADVPDFTDVLIHVGNYPRDTEGCILVGNERTEDAVGASVECWLPLMREIQASWDAGQTPTITIADPGPEAGA